MNKKIKITSLALVMCLSLSKAMSSINLKKLTDTKIKALADKIVGDKLDDLKIAKKVVEDYGALYPSNLKISNDGEVSVKDTNKKIEVDGDDKDINPINSLDLISILGYVRTSSTKSGKDEIFTYTGWKSVTGLLMAGVAGAVVTVFGASYLDKGEDE